jgi:hypothetical protein
VESPPVAKAPEPPLDRAEEVLPQPQRESRIAPFIAASLRRPDESPARPAAAPERKPEAELPRYLMQPRTKPIDDAVEEFRLDLKKPVVIGGAVIASLPAARLSDRIGRKRVIYISFVLSAGEIVGMAASPSLPLTLLSVIPVGLSAGAFLAVDWALMTDIIPKATAGRYMGISNVATASAGPLGLAVAGVVLYVVTRAGVPTPDGGDLESIFLGVAPRAAIGSMLIFVAGAAWALRKVNEKRRED